MDDPETNTPLNSDLAGHPDLDEAIGIFVEGLPAHIEAIEQAYAKANFTALAYHAHQLKGTGGLCGFQSIRESAMALEQLAKAQDGGSIDAAKRLINLCRRARAK